MQSAKWGCRYFSISQGNVVYRDIWPTTVAIPKGVKLVDGPKPVIVEETEKK